MNVAAGAGAAWIINTGSRPAGRGKTAQSISSTFFHKLYHIVAIFGIFIKFITFFTMTTT